MAVEEPHLLMEACDRLENVNSPTSEMIKSKKCGVLSTPTVRGLAKEYGIDITDVHGTGTDGRVLKEDVLRYAADKRTMEGSSASLGTDHEDQFLGGAQTHQNVSAKSGWHYNDETIPLR